jgi:hypothetical protein
VLFDVNKHRACIFQSVGQADLALLKGASRECRVPIRGTGSRGAGTVFPLIPARHGGATPDLSPEWHTAKTHAQMTHVSSLKQRPGQDERVQDCRLLSSRTCSD